MNDLPFVQLGAPVLILENMTYKGLLIRIHFRSLVSLLFKTLCRVDLAVYVLARYEEKVHL